MPPLIQLLAAWLGFVGLIWTIFDRTEKVLTDHARRSLADWLRNVKPKEGNQAWIEIFRGILNTVFGSDYLSWKTFGRSCIASTIALTAMMLVYFVKAESPLVNLSNTPNLIVVWTLATFFLDYVSLCESRGAISEMGKVGTGGVILLLIGDVILTSSIFVAGSSFALMNVQDTGGAQEVALLVGSTKGAAEMNLINVDDSNNAFDPNNPRIIEQIASTVALSKAISQALDLTLNGLFFWRNESATPLFGIFFWSTFITSVWVWLYTLGGWVIKAVEYLGFGTAKFRRWLDIENKPLLAIGYMCMILVTLGFVFILIF